MIGGHPLPNAQAAIIVCHLSGFASQVVIGLRSIWPARDPPRWLRNRSCSKSRRRSTSRLMGVSS